MKKTDIKKLNDKNLQLRYYLGGLEIMTNNRACKYWRCDINCSCSPVPDDNRLTKVKEFIKNHNLTNDCFVRTAYNYLTGAIMKYKGKYSPFFIELDSVLKPYNFVCEEIKTENEFRDKELEELINDNSNKEIKDYISKYNLSIEDFIVLAKTSINYNYYVMRGLDKDCDIDFTSNVADIIHKHGLAVTREYIENYKEEYKKSHENTKLVVDTKLAQKKYLKLLKELLEKDPDKAIDLIIEDLSDLTLNAKKSVNGIEKSLKKTYK